MPKIGKDYAFRTELQLPFEQAVSRVIEELQAEGFGVLTEIDVQTTLKQKLDVDFRKYVILGACNPPLAHQALSVDLEIGLLLPCNVIVYEENGASTVAIMNPISILGLIESTDVDRVANEASSRLKRVLVALRS